MTDDFYTEVYNPDVLSCLANLSSDEVFTPPGVANQMLDLLPQELFTSPDTKFLDPACKSGVFLREIAKRLLKGLEPIFPDLQLRTDHIFKHQLFGIAITELTSLLSRRGLYCSKYPNSDYSVTRFTDAEGNVRFKRIPHTWKNTRCVYCGATQSQFDRDLSLETHAYELIHASKPEEIFKMKFDVIVGNPPYHLNDGGNSASAIPIYQKFVQQAIKLNPRYLSMIIPSRWFAGGKGLDNFRRDMLNDKRIVKIVDYVNAKDCFPGISLGGGVLYFLWDRDNPGLCEFTNIHDTKSSTSLRSLSEYPTFVRYNEAISIIQKVMSYNERSVTEIVSSRNPFGFSSSTRGKPSGNVGDVTLFSSGGISYVPLKSVTQGTEAITKFKVMISKVTSEHAGEPDKTGKFRVISRAVILQPQQVCTDSYLISLVTDDEKEINNYYGYIYTKFFRFLLLQAVTSINLSKEKFCFVPLQDFSKEWTDCELYKKYGLVEDEIAFIDSMIKPMEIEGTSYASK